MDTLPLCCADVRRALAPLTLRQIGALAALSGVPAPTIYKIKRGETANPGIETVRKFLTHIDVVLDRAAPTSAPTTEAGHAR